MTHTKQVGEIFRLKFARGWTSANGTAGRTLMIAENAPNKHYRALRDCILRKDVAKDSEKVGSLTKNMVMEALEVKKDPKTGRTRILLESGWASEIMSKTDERLLKEVKFVDSKNKQDAADEIREDEAKKARNGSQSAPPKRWHVGRLDRDDHLFGPGMVHNWSGNGSQCAPCPLTATAIPCDHTHIAYSCRFNVAPAGEDVDGKTSKGQGNKGQASDQRGKPEEPRRVIHDEWGQELLGQVLQNPFARTGLLRPPSVLRRPPRVLRRPPGGASTPTHRPPSVLVTARH